MGLIDDCQTFFGINNLYDVLGIEQSASEAELKKAYKKISLLCHPDRVPAEKKDEATRKFQTVSKIYNILSDAEKRIVYDETGSIDEESCGFDDKDWESYWRLLFPKITVKKINEFMEKYKGSQDEIDDLKKCYIQYEGDMNKISETFIGYDVNEEEKYKNILKELIKNKEIPSFPNFENEKKSKVDARRKRLKKEAKESEALQEENSLVNAIMKNSASRERQFNNMMKNLEAKYCNPSKRGSKKK